MIIQSYNDDDNITQLIAVNGDRFIFTARDLVRFIGSSSFLMVLILWVGLLSVANDGLFGVAMPLGVRCAFWVVVAAAWTLFWTAQYWLVETFAKKTGRSLIVISLGFHILPAVLAVRIGAGLVDQITDIPNLLEFSTLSHYLQLLVFGLAFEFFLASSALYALTQCRVMQVFSFVRRLQKKTGR